jgi:alpha-beta hydrolase superfamily lysophospholipase
MTEKRDITFDSGDGRTKIHALRWEPAQGEVKAVLQIVHGMVEFVERYEEFAEFLVEKGFVVTGNDHLGHGGSITSREEYGFFAEKDGNRILLEDIHTLKQKTAQLYPDVPYFILGHSMGSFLLRQYLCLHGEEMDGAIIMGTGTQPPALLKVGKGLCSIMARFHGWHYRSKFIDALAFGGYNRHFKPARTEADWLTKEEAIVDRYRADERCTFRFTVNGYYNLFTSIEEASLESNMQKMPKDLPVLFVSGAEDPVGNFGKGVEHVRKEFQRAGMTDVTWILYENDRHEILNETDRETVYQNLYAWLYVRMTK